MTPEALFDESVDTDNEVKLEKSIELTMGAWVYFFIFEKEGVNTPVSTDKVDYIITTSKENPINIPLIKDSSGVNGVIYFTSEIAVKFAEFNCRVAKMKGKKALQLFLDLSAIDAVYLQSDYNNVRIPKNEIRRLLATYA